jgi:hypothetical protein
MFRNPYALIAYGPITAVFFQCDRLWLIKTQEYDRDSILYVVLIVGWTSRCKIGMLHKGWSKSEIMYLDVSRCLAKGFKNPMGLSNLFALKSYHRNNLTHEDKVWLIRVNWESRELDGERFRVPPSEASPAWRIYSHACHRHLDFLRLSHSSFRDTATLD